MQSLEEVMEELTKLKAHLEERQEDQEGRSRRNNIRIYSIPEGSENKSSSMIVCRKTAETWLVFVRRRGS